MLGFVIGDILIAILERAVMFAVVPSRKTLIVSPTVSTRLWTLKMMFPTVTEQFTSC